MKTIRFEGIDHSFPDDASDDEISQALEAMHPANPAEGMRMGHEAEGAFGGEQTPPKSKTSVTQTIFPTATQPQPDSQTVRTAKPIPGTMAYAPLNYEEKTVPVTDVEKAGRTAVAGAFDLASAPTRATGAAAGSLGYDGATGGDKPFKEGMADPKTGLARPAREYLGGVIAEQVKDLKDPERAIWQKAGDAILAALAGGGYLVASAAEDPTTWIGMAASKAPQAAEKAVQGAAKPVSRTVTATREGVADALEGAAGRVQNTIVRPRQADVMGGFEIQNFPKYGIQGNLDEVLTKSKSQMDEAAKALQALIKEGRDKGATVNLNHAINDVLRDIAKDRAGNAAIIKDVQPSVDKLRQIASLVSKDGKANLLDAHKFKQQMGDLGAFEHIAGRQGVQISPDERAFSQLASRLYLKLKDRIEKAAPEGVKEQNKVLSDLIPVHSAAAYRKIVADRNNVVKLSDMMGAMATIGGGPPGLALWAATKATTSGATVKTLYRLAQAFRTAQGPEQMKYAKALENLGISAAELDALRAAGNVVDEAAVAGNAIETPFQRAAEADSVPEESPRLKKLRAALEKATDEKAKARIQAEIDREQAKTLSMKD